MIKRGRISCNIEYDIIKDSKGNYYAFVSNLFVDPIMRGNGIATRLLAGAIQEIKKNTSDMPILLQAEPFGVDGLNKKQLLNFYSKFYITVTDEYPVIDVKEILKKKKKS